MEQPYDDKRLSDHCVCPVHPFYERTLWCVECRQYLCTKCLIQQREEHRSHELIEIRDMYEDASAKLE